MTDNGDGTYTYKVPAGIENPHVVFNYKSGNRQYPKSGGLKVENGKLYTVDQ